MVGGDQLPIVDVNATTSPTGETKYVTLTDLGVWIAQNGLIAPPFQSWQYANGLYFDDTVVPGGASLSSASYGKCQSLGTSSFCLITRFNVPSGSTGNNRQALFGVSGDAIYSSSGSLNSAYIGIEGTNLVGHAGDSASMVDVVIPGFFNTYYDRTVHVILNKSSDGSLQFIVNGALITSASIGQVTGSIGNTRLFMNTGTVGRGFARCTIYEAQIHNSTSSLVGAAQHFYGGANVNKTSLISSFIPTNLQPGNTQWLDAVGNNHILLPVSGALATNPSKRFSLRYYLPNPGQPMGSSYLGVGGVTFKEVLPPNYVLTSCLVSSWSGSLSARVPNKPLLSLGTSAATASVGSYGTDSYNNNRVPLTSASYGINNLEILQVGMAHVSRSIYVYFASSSDAPCTFSFEGYIRD